MRKIIAGINMTLDGFCDHTKVDPDEEIHQHYSDLLRSSGVIIFGRITYELMEFWKTVIENPTGNQAMDDFAAAIDRIPKVVFSHTLTEVGWKTARVATRGLEEEVRALKEQPGPDILVGSRSLITSLMKAGLIDELQLTIHPVIVGDGLPLFESITDRTTLKLIGTKTFGCGAVTLTYQ